MLFNPTWVKSLIEEISTMFSYLVFLSGKMVNKIKVMGPVRFEFVEQEHTVLVLTRHSGFNVEFPQEFFL